MYLSWLTRNRQDVDDIVYEVDAAMITVTESEVDIGGNPSAEEAEDTVEASSEKVINLVHSFSLQSTMFDKKSYLTYLKVRSAARPN